MCEPKPSFGGKIEKGRENVKRVKLPGEGCIGKVIFCPF
jgi:hypothetical protein